MAKKFDKSTYPWSKEIDYRKHPEDYLVGRGEQGVLLCEPYRSEILPYWKFKTPEIARESSQKILSLFYNYLEQGEFVGADLARKFLQMGFTRSRRYANYKGGRKYLHDGTDHTFVKGSGDSQKIESAAIFFKAWKRAEVEPHYQQQKNAWKQQEKMKADTIKAGDAVSWKASQGTVKGKVVKKINKDTTVKVGDNKERKVKASTEDPQVVVKSDASGKQAVHKSTSLKKPTK